MKMKKTTSREQDVKLPLENFDDSIKSEASLRRHRVLLPNTMRTIFVGPSSSGKTNALLSIIKSKNGLSFENKYIIYSISLFQLKYRYLETLLKPIKEIGFYQFSDREQVVSPEDATKFSDDI